MNTSQAILFSRQSILRIAVILVIGYALTALAINLWAQAASPVADGWAPVSNPARAGSYGFSATDGLTDSVATVTRSNAPFIMISFRLERDPRAVITAVFALPPTISDTSRDTKPQAVSGLFTRGFYSHP